MKLYRLERKTILNTTLETAWQFFSSPHNLSKITPPTMAFTVITKDLPDTISTGLLIEYRVRPLWSIPLKWVTEIKELVPYEYFADEQLKGPYKYWRHEHFFIQTTDGVLMEDKLAYGLPFGWPGRIVGLPIVKTKLESLFDFRLQAIQNIFPGSKLVI